METNKEHNIVTIKNLVAFGEFLLLNACFIFTFAISEKEYNIHELIRTIPRSYFVLINLSYTISLSYVGIILDQRIVNIENILNKVTKTCVLFSLMLLMIVTFLNDFDIFSNLYWILFISMFFCSTSFWRICARIILKHYRSKGNNYKRVIILGAGSIANELYRTISMNTFYGYKFLGFFDDRDKSDYKVADSLVKGTINDVYEFVATNDVDEIFCALPAGEDRKVLPIIRYAEKNMIRCFIVPDFKRFIKKQVSLTFLGDVSDAIPIISLRDEPLLSPQNKLAKRTFDILASASFLTFAFPFLYVIIGSIIKATSSGPIFFKQVRTGKNGKDFTCLKFRTMRINKDSDTKQATKGDARITRIGAFLRKTNLDEMPQFVNVFIGNMSIVGPRPHMLKHTQMYSELINEYMVRHYAKPGITGWAQVTGFRGETKTIEEMEGRVKRDVWYIENWTFWLDLKIIILTVVNMLRGEEKAY
ncbi:MAG: undecaprenyl-phosphate glucose phosphotransferase [Paludibacteraceae bacterium]|nr:undecaprenyl-phosphate glucose phosphotransferase [Prevotellaceae bacterium]